MRIFAFICCGPSLQSRIPARDDDPQKTSDPVLLFYLSLHLMRNRKLYDPVPLLLSLSFTLSPFSFLTLTSTYSFLNPFTWQKKVLFPCSAENMHYENRSSWPCSGRIFCFRAEWAPSNPFLLGLVIIPLRVSLSSWQSKASKLVETSDKVKESDSRSLQINIRPRQMGLILSI